MSKISDIKRREANRRLAVIRRARKSRGSAEAEQRRVSLAGRHPWQITNLKEVGNAMAKWD